MGWSTRIKRAVRRSDNDPAPDDRAPDDRVADLVAAGRLVDAVDALAELNRREPTGAREQRLVELRAQAAVDLPASGPAAWPPSPPDPFPGSVGVVPEISRADLRADVLGGAVSHHGALVVRGLLGADRVAELRDVVERAEAARIAGADGADDRWYRPFDTGVPDDRSLRNLVARHGGTWLADSPAGTALVLESLAESGATAAITEHFGDRPLFSLQKSTLRRSPPVFNFAGWHQDGSFLGDDARAMNVWVALSPCGGDLPTPGLELVPARVEQVVGPDKAGTAWVSDDRAMAAAGGITPVCPLFAPGDAILFDERFLHRTHLTPEMTDERFAIECWFFAPGYTSPAYCSLLA